MKRILILNVFGKNFDLDFFLSEDIFRHVELSSGVTNSKFIFTLMKYGSMSAGKIGFNTLQVRNAFVRKEDYRFDIQRRWAGIELDRSYQIRPYIFDKNVQSIATLVLEVDFLNKKKYFAMDDFVFFFIPQSSVFLVQQMIHMIPIKWQLNFFNNISIMHSPLVNVYVIELIFFGKRIFCFLLVTISISG